jgi:hypothetical protein
MEEVIDILKCGHTHFDLERMPGKGYQGHCPDCDTRGELHNTAGGAMESFEKKVRSRRAAARRELAKQAVAKGV